MYKFRLLVGIFLCSVLTTTFAFHDLTSFFKAICADHEKNCPQVIECIKPLPEYFETVKGDCMEQVGQTRDINEIHQVMCDSDKNSAEMLRKCVLKHKDVKKYSLTVDDAVTFLNILNCLQKIDIPISK